VRLAVAIERAIETENGTTTCAVPASENVFVETWSEMLIVDEESVTGSGSGYGCASGESNGALNGRGYGYDYGCETVNENESGCGGGCVPENASDLVRGACCCARGTVRDPFQ